MPWMPDSLAEWLESDGLGGYAMGTVCGRRTRRYHSLLTVATSPPTGRMTLVNGFDVWIEGEGQDVPLSTQLYTPYVVAPDNTRWLDDFVTYPWPTWTFRLPDGPVIRQELFMLRGQPTTILRWRCLTPDYGGAPLRLHLRPFLSGRDHHADHTENAAFDFSPEHEHEQWTWKPYDGVPAIHAFTNGRYTHQPVWYRHFLYEHERERGLNDTEDLASPGKWTWNLATEDAVLIWTTQPDSLSHGPRAISALETTQRWAASESSRRGELPARRRSIEQYLVKPAGRSSIIAGYPWFTDWGRDTFISLRGLCLATGDLATAGEILDAWSIHVSEGMLPNRFPDSGAEPEYNSVDASLWYIIAVREYLDLAERQHILLTPEHHQRLDAAIEQIFAGYSQGTRYQIHLDDDGLIACGEPGVQLTWMDAKVGDWVVTPRIGKPVEIQALWLNALAAFPQHHPSAEDWLQHGRKSFERRFWNATTGCLNDVVDVDHRDGQVDAMIGPNQVFALGGLPLTLTSTEHTGSALAVVEQHLLTPLGLRTRSPADPGYHGRFQGSVRERDGAYHTGTVWPWLIGSFVEAWIKRQVELPEARQLARERFLTPLERHFKEAGLDHISEVADGDAPFTPRGCPFQAWSLGEYLRLDRQVLC
ncbi:glycogen debranching protein [bacterium]|nr:glycogen debranching protein [bacterium]